MGAHTVVALCGSLRAQSVNLALLEAFAELNPAGTSLRLYDWRDLPIFNPDHEDAPDPALDSFRAALAGADALVMASPEYAHGIPGAFKNALDWVVGSAELDGKPVLLLCASARPQHAPAQLAEVLRTMGAKVSGPHAVNLPSQIAAAQAQLQTPEMRTELGELLAAFVGGFQAL